MPDQPETPSVETLQAELEAAKTREQVYQFGIVDPEGVELAQFMHGRLPAEGRPAIGDWLKGLKGDAVPKALAPYLPGQPEPAPAATAPAAKSTPAVRTTAAASPATTRGQAGPAPGSVGWDAARIRAAREEAERSGDYTALREAMPEIRRSVARR